MLVNGAVATAGCDTTITFTSEGFTPGFSAVAASRGEVRSAATAYDVLMQIRSAGPGNNPKDSRALVVDVSFTPRFEAPAVVGVSGVSHLEVPGGRGQVVLNGSEALFPAAGQVPLSLRLRSGENRIEAQLVQTQGRPGLWRFELGKRTFAPGSLRVVAGEVALVTPDAVTFRMKGRPGERVVFTFRSRR